MVHIIMTSLAAHLFWWNSTTPRNAKLWRNGPINFAWPMSLYDVSPATGRKEKTKKGQSAV
jgi:hypothetical protein